ncbi:response regulator [Pseudoduganella namucuonensis]|nr:response regulator [Pseudoduganella namucuonensis]
MTQQQSTSLHTLPAVDWSRGALGAPAQWPHSLRLTVDIMLNCPLPMALEWGPEQILFYNHAYAALAGLRPDTVPGCRVPPMQPPVFGWNRAALASAWDGAALAFSAEQLPLWRQGSPATQWLDLHYTPVRDESGAVGGVLCALRLAEAPPPARFAAPASPAGQADDGGRRILVVEDNADARYLVCEMLRALGHEVDAAADGEDALAMLAQRPYGILFSDVSLPGMSGVELARAAHGRYPDLRVIFASGYSNALTSHLDFPATAMQKPYDLEQLQRALAGPAA